MLAKNLSAWYMYCLQDLIITRRLANPLNSSPVRLSFRLLSDDTIMFSFFGFFIKFGKSKKAKMKLSFQLEKIRHVNDMTCVNCGHLLFFFALAEYK
jgi:hypothetical protein